MFFCSLSDVYLCSSLRFWLIRWKLLLYFPSSIFPSWNPLGKTAVGIAWMGKLKALLTCLALLRDEINYYNLPMWFYELKIVGVCVCVCVLWVFFLGELVRFMSIHAAWAMCLQFIKRSNIVIKAASNILPRCHGLIVIFSTASILCEFNQNLSQR